MEKECSPPKRIFCFELEYPIKRSASARFTFTDAKAADESQRYTIPKVDISSDQVLLLQDVEVRKAWTRPDNSLPEGHLVANLARVKFSINLPVPNRKRGQKE